jgi:Cu/Ag efflux protein CusF
MYVRNVLLAVALGLSIPHSAYADDVHHKNGDVKTASAALSEGEVRKVDKDAGKVTIKHGPLKNLGMPPMTMVFQVKDRAMLDQVNVGDKIGFVADKVNGAYTVIQLETAK